MLSHFGLADQISISYRQTVGNRSEAKRRCIGNPSGIFRFPGVTFWEWLILLRLWPTVLQCLLAQANQMNHIVWYLQTYPDNKTLVIVSHDRTFLSWRSP